MRRSERDNWYAIAQSYYQAYLGQLRAAQTWDRTGQSYSAQVCRDIAADNLESSIRATLKSIPWWRRWGADCNDLLPRASISPGSS